MRKTYTVELSSEERERLTAVVVTGKAAAYRRTHAQILLWADQGEEGPCKTDREIAELSGRSRQTVENIRRRCVLEGLESALERRRRSREKPTCLDGEGEAQLVAIACSDAPLGRSRWTLQLLCDELVERKVVTSISYETVRRVLKKHLKTVASGDVVHSAHSGSGVCLPNGSGP